MNMLSNNELYFVGKHIYAPPKIWNIYSDYVQAQLCVGEIRNHFKQVLGVL
jgi:hypothetical protein